VRPQKNSVPDLRFRRNAQEQLPARPLSGPESFPTGLGEHLGALDEARRKRSPKGLRIQCCRSTAGQAEREACALRCARYVRLSERPCPVVRLAWLPPPLQPTRYGSSSYRRPYRAHSVRRSPKPWTASVFQTCDQTFRSLG